MSIKQSTCIRTSFWAKQAALMLRNYDLYLSVGLMALLPFPLLRVPLGLVLVLIAPGYALVAALFPRRADLDSVARAALSFGLSVAVLPVLALVLNALPWGIHPWPIALVLALWMILLSGIALWRRSIETPEASYAPPVANPATRWYSMSAPTKAFYTVGALVLTGVLIGGGFSLLTLDPAADMTEFYALGSDGMAENYPREVAPGQEMPVRLGITNREGATARYRVLVRAEGQLLSQTDPITIENGATWEGPVRYTLARAGDDQRIEILLFRNDDAQPYRQLWLWVNVRQAPE